MESIGDIFRDAREKKGVTESKAASATRIKVQHIRAMEQSDFSEFAAPTYAKGFIKLYAEYLGLDAHPLIQHYNEQHAPGERAPLVPEDAPRRRERERPLVDWSKIPWGKLKPTREQSLLIAKVAGIVVVVLGLATVFKGCGGSGKIEQVAEKEVTPLPRGATVIAEPPEPFLDVDFFSR